MTNDTAITGELVEQPDEHGDALGGLFGGLDMGALFGQLGIDLPSPDDATVNELAEQIDELAAKVDWIAYALLATVAKAPGRFAPDLPPYPAGD